VISIAGSEYCPQTYGNDITSKKLYVLCLIKVVIINVIAILLSVPQRDEARVGQNQHLQSSASH